MTGSAFATTLTVPSGGFEVIEGEPVVGGLHGPEVHHQHCDRCKSWVFTRVEPDQGFVNIRATQLDDANWFRPFLEVYTSEKLPWAETGAPHSFFKFPALSDYGPLIEAFGASGIGPLPGG